MTAVQIITSAYRKIGIDRITTTKLADGLEDLQNMLSLWSVDGLLVPANVTEILTLTSGQAVYTIGENGSPDFNTIRPNKLISGFIKIGENDFKVRTDLSLQEFNDISQKAIEGRPRAVYYDPQYPNANLKFNYEANAALAFHLTSEKILTNPSATTDTFSFPLEYNHAMIYNLALHLTSDKNTKISPNVALQAESSLETLRDYNGLDKLASPVKLESAIVYGSGRGSYMNFNAGE